jgi:DNA repair exonuclease SbcCD nuclease subunit
MDWFCYNAIKQQADNVIFLGDWYENRSAVNVSTLNYSYLAAKKLNDLNIPVYFIVGNHDLYMRHTREVFSTAFFQEFSNFTIINEPTIIPEILHSPLICPFLFPDEYPDLAKHLNTPVWFGHFEFKGFVVTGQSVIMKSGPDHTLFKGPDYIFSGHFHKRQKGGNVVYIGNTFPTNFSDATTLNEV